MQPYLSKIHHQAVRSARQFHRSEFQLIEAIQQVDSKKVYRHFGHANLFSYCVKELRLSEGNTYAFIKVARKSVEIPEIKKAIGEGKLSVSKAKRVMSVITKSSQEEWIEKAATLPQRSLEQEVVRVSPRTEKREAVRPVSAGRSEVRMGLDQDQAEQLRQVQDLVSQKLGRAATLEDCMKVLMGEYIERHDPVRKAQRRRKASAPLRQARHIVVERDRNQCTFVHPDGSRCPSKRWLDVHHIQPRSVGGVDTPENLQLLCRGHHQAAHWLEPTQVPRGTPKSRLTTSPKDKINQRNHGFTRGLFR